MPDVHSDARWERLDDGTIRLNGAWTLVLDPARRRRLAGELAQLGAPHAHGWDLTGLDALDSAGATLLWDAWGRRLPERFTCPERHRHWFQWLAATALPKRAASRPLAAAFDRFGAGVLAVAGTIGGMLLLIGQLLLDVGYCIRHPREIPWKETTATIYQMGASSMLLLGGIGFLIGVVMAIQIGITLQQFGANTMIIGLMGLAVLRELGPVITGIILAGRSGSAMTAGIGAMHLTGEYDALRAFGSPPSVRLALPRVIGALVSVPLLVVWSDFTALIGGAITAQADLGIGYRLFLDQLPQQVQIVNFWIGLAKGGLFGVTIALVGCYFGMTAQPDTASLSRNTTLSVVTSLTLILVFDASSGALLTNVGLL